MAGDLQPLDEKFAIVGSDGRPTLYFIKWAQQRQIDITGAITEEQFNELLLAYLAAHKLQEGSGIQITPSGNLSDSPTIAADVQEILDQISTTRGAVIYRGLLGWAALGPGAAGQFLKTNGAGADPAWAAAGGGGNETLIQKLSVAGVATVSFTGIPATYDAILIYMNLVGANFTGIRVNNDATAVYQMQRTGYANGTINLQSLAQTQWVMGAGFGYTNYKMTGNVIGYADATDSKELSLIGTGAFGAGGGGLGSGNLAQVEFSGLWAPAVPATINRLDFNFAANMTRGYVALYGRNF